MLKEEAIDILFGCIEAHSEEENEALDMAIEALKRERTDEWCTDCKEYDTEKKCCPRFNRVIRGAVADALEAVPSADRQMVIKCKPFLSEEDFKAFAEQASDQNVILVSNEAEVVSTNTSTKSTNISIDAPADRSRGKWIPVSEKLPSEKKAVLICDSGGNCFVGKLVLTDYGYKWGVPLCVVWVDIEDGDAWMPLPEPFCGADMRGDTE